VARLRGGLASQLGALRFRPYANDSLEAEFEELGLPQSSLPLRVADERSKIRAETWLWRCCGFDGLRKKAGEAAVSPHCVAV